MNVAFVSLHLIHVFSGVFRAGSSFVLARFMEPAVAASQPESSKFMQKFMDGGFLIAQSVAGLLTVLVGLILYWNDSGGLQASWITTPTGLGFTLGAIGGLAASYLRFFISGPTASKIAALGKQMQNAGKPPTPEQIAQVKALQERLTSASILAAIALALTVAAMATARYL